MPPYLPVLSTSRSRSMRLGRGPGNAVVSQFNVSALTPGVNPQTGGLQLPFYADLGDPQVRRDIARHTSVGGLLSFGSPSLTISSDVFRSSGLAVTAGAGLSVNVASGVIKSRTYGNTLAVGAVTNLALAPSHATLDRTDLVIVNLSGVVSVVQGTNAAAATSVAPVTPSNTMPIATVLVAATVVVPGTITVAYPTS